MKKWLALIVPALCSAKCTNSTPRNLEVVYVYDGVDPDHPDGFQDIADWISDISGESYGAQLKFTAVMSGGMNSDKCFQHVTGPTDDIAAAVADMKATPWLGDDEESDNDSPNVLNTLVYATSLFDEENVWPEWDRILVYVSGAYVPQWGEKVTQPSLAEGQMKCSGAPPTRNQLVDALEAKRIKMVLSLYGDDEVKPVRYWFKRELFAHFKDLSMYAFGQPRNTASEVVAKTRELVYQLYCVKNIRLYGYVDTVLKATRDATGYSGAISTKLDCLISTAKRAIKASAFAYKRDTCAITKVRPTEDSMRAHDVGIREAVIADKPTGSVPLEDHNSLLAVPYLLYDQVCDGNAGTLCVMTFIAEQSPEFASEKVDLDYRKLNCNQPTGSPYQMLGRLLEYMQELVVIVPPDLPNADEIYQQWKTAGEGIFTTRVFVIDPKVKIADETDRVVASLSNLLGFTLEDAQKATADPKADVEMQVIVDNLSVGDIKHASSIGRGLFGATGSFCAHWIHNHDLRGAMVEVGTDNGLCATEGDSELRSMEELGFWTSPRVYSQSKYDVASCAVMREVVHRATLFSSPQEKPIRKVLLLVTHSSPSSGTDLVDFTGAPECDLSIDCPHKEQLRTALEMAEVSVFTLTRSKNDQSAWTSFWNQVGVDYHKEVTFSQYEITYWDQLRQVRSLGYFPATFTCVKPPESPIRIFMIADSSHTQVTQDATALAVMFAPYRVQKMLEAYTSDIEITFYSSSLLDSPQCFKEIGLVTTDPDLDLIDSLPFVEESNSEDLSVVAGSLHITSRVADKANANLIVYATDKVFKSGTATTLPDPLTCPINPPTDAAFEAAALKSRTGFIIGVNIVSTILGLEETWKYKTRTLPNTGNVININFSRRSWAYNSMMAIATSVCGGVYDPGDTAQPPGIIDAVKNLAPIVAGIGAAVGAVMGGLAIWKIYQPPRQLSFTMEGSGDLDDHNTGNEVQGIAADEGAFE